MFMMANVQKKRNTFHVLQIISCKRKPCIISFLFFIYGEIVSTHNVYVL